MDNKKYLEKQNEICAKHSKIPDLVELGAFIALGKDFNANIQINGLRHPATSKLSGWYIWSGADFDRDEVNYFAPSHVYHFIEDADFIIQYLGLPVGSRFVIDKKGYEDIWYDKELLNV